MIEQYLIGKLRGSKLKEFEQTLYAYTLSDNVVVVTSFNFEDESILKMLNDNKAIEEHLKKQDFFFIGQLKRRTRKAQKRLYDKLYPKIRNHILKNSGDENDVHDFTQEVIIKLYEKLKKDTSKITTLEGFAFGILRNMWLKELEKRKKIGEKNTDYGKHQDTSTDPEEAYNDDAEQRTRILRESMDKLKPEQRDFLEYYDLQSHNIKETALHFELDEVSVRVRANRCRKYLKKKLIEHPEYNKYF